MRRNIEEVEFTIFDTETTGLDCRRGDKIVELAAMKFKGDEIIDRYETLINPLRPISEAAFRVNQISEQMLETAPIAQKILPDFLNFIRGSCLCSYNIPFDLGFINSELSIAGLKQIENTPAVDILTMARKLVPGLEKYALWFVAKKFGITQEQKHRAFSDVEITRKVFSILISTLKEKGISDYKSFLTLFGMSFEELDNLNTEKFSQIQKAISLQANINIKYFSCNDLVLTNRQVFPKFIKQERNSWYLVGFCNLKNDERTFRIDSILDVQIV